MEVCGCRRGDSPSGVSSDSDEDDFDDDRPVDEESRPLFMKHVNTSHNPWQQLQEQVPGSVRRDLLAAVKVKSMAEQKYQNSKDDKLTLFDVAGPALTFVLEQFACFWAFVLLSAVVLVSTASCTDELSELFELTPPPWYWLLVFSVWAMTLWTEQRLYTHLALLFLQWDGRKALLPGEVLMVLHVLTPMLKHVGCPHGWLTTFLLRKSRWLLRLAATSGVMEATLRSIFYARLLRVALCPELLAQVEDLWAAAMRQGGFLFRPRFLDMVKLLCLLLLLEPLLVVLKVLPQRRVSYGYRSEKEGYDNLFCEHSYHADLLENIISSTRIGYAREGIRTWKLRRASDQLSRDRKLDRFQDILIRATRNCIFDFIVRVLLPVPVSMEVLGTMTALSLHSVGSDSLLNHKMLALTFLSSWVMAVLTLVGAVKYSLAIDGVFAEGRERSSQNASVAVGSPVMGQRDVELQCETPEPAAIKWLEKQRFEMCWLLRLLRGLCLLFGLVLLHAGTKFVAAFRCQDHLWNLSGCVKIE